MPGPDGRGGKCGHWRQCSGERGTGLLLWWVGALGYGITLRSLQVGKRKHSIVDEM